MKVENNYKLPIDDTLFAYSILKKLGAGNVDTFEQRLKSQKVQYLAQAFGVSPVYGFSLYLHGPYSPDLTSDLFTLSKDKIKPDLSEFIPDSLKEKFIKLSDFIKNKDVRQLELVATLHLFKMSGLSRSDAEKKLAEIKKANEKEINYALEQIKLIPCLQ